MSAAHDSGPLLVAGPSIEGAAGALHRGEGKQIMPTVLFKEASAPHRSCEIPTSLESIMKTPNSPPPNTGTFLHKELDLSLFCWKRGAERQSAFICSLIKYGKRVL